MSLSVKVCGITREVDADFALQNGASRIGFILYEKSPRKINFKKIDRIRESLNLQPSCMVAVQVEPTIETLNEIINFGFGCIQLHSSHNFSLGLINKWSDMVGPERLLLAPKLPNGKEFPKDIIPFADTFLIDAHMYGKFGGTGKLANWNGFARWQNLYKTKNWILAGGLSSQNIESAVKATQAKLIDVNSGVENSPGVKDHSLLKEFLTIIS